MNDAESEVERTVITEEQYKLMCKIRDNGGSIDLLKDLNEREIKIFKGLIAKGYVRFGTESEAKENAKKIEEMFGIKADDETDDAEKRIEPELKPRTRAFLAKPGIVGLVLSLLLSFCAGVLTRYALGMILEF